MRPQDERETPFGTYLLASLLAHGLLLWLFPYWDTLVESAASAERGGVVQVVPVQVPQPPQRAQPAPAEPARPRPTPRPSPQPLPQPQPAQVVTAPRPQPQPRPEPPAPQPQPQPEPAPDPAPGPARAAEEAASERLTSPSGQESAPASQGAGGRPDPAPPQPREEAAQNAAFQTAPADAGEALSPPAPSQPEPEQTEAPPPPPSGEEFVLQSGNPIYPKQAQDQGWVGTVLLAVQVAADGTLQAVEVHTSSGSSFLDDHALQTVQRSWRFRPASSDYVVLVAIRYQKTDGPGGVAQYSTAVSYEGLEFLPGR